MLPKHLNRQIMLTSFPLRQKIISLDGPTAVSLPFKSLGQQANEIVDGLTLTEHHLPTSRHQPINSFQSGDRKRYNPLILPDEQTGITVKQFVRTFPGQDSFD